MAPMQGPKGKLVEGKLPSVLRPMLPCVRAAVDVIAAWVEHGAAPPASRTISRPQGASASDLANNCSLQ